MHACNDRAFLHPSMRWMMPEGRRLLQTGGAYLNIEFVGLMIVQMVGEDGRKFIYMAHCMYVPGLMSSILLCETQLVTCEGCGERKQLHQGEVYQQIQTRDWRGVKRKLRVKADDGIYEIPLYKVDVKQMMRMIPEGHEYPGELPQAMKGCILSATVGPSRKDATFKLNEYLQLHSICGHNSQDVIVKTVKGGAIEGLDIDNMVKVNNKCACFTCSQGDNKHHEQPKRRVSATKRPFDELHVDIVYMPSESGEPRGILDDYMPVHWPYALVAVDEYTRFKFVLAMPAMTIEWFKSGLMELDSTAREMIGKLLISPNGQEHMKNFSHKFTWEEVNDTSKCIFKSIRSDQGSQMSALFDSPYDESQLVKLTKFDSEILWNRAEPYHPRQNGLVERSIGVLKQKAMAARIEAGIGPKGAYHALEYSAFTSNIFYSSAVETSPFMKMFGFPFNAKTRKLHPFGALAFTLNETGRKGSIPRTAGIFLGYEDYPRRGYVVSQLDPKYSGTGPAFRATFVTSEMTTISHSWMHDRQLAAKHHLDMCYPWLPIPKTIQENPGPQQLREETRVTTLVNTPDEDDDVPPANPTNVWANSEESVAGADIAEDEEDSVYLSANGTFGDSLEEEEVSSSAIAMGMTAYLGSKPTKRPLRTMSIRIGSGKTRNLEDVPTAEKEASMREEFEGFQKNGIGVQMFLPKGAHVTDMKVVQSMRRDDTVKSRFAVRGFHQVYGFDYFNTYAPVATPTSIRTTISLGATFNVPLWTADAEKAFLQADMEEDVYIKIPAWMPLDKSKGNVLKLKKSVYGCKQSSRNWWMKLQGAVLECGLVQDKKDPCLFYSFDHRGNIQLAVCIVVDDILGAAPECAWTPFIKKLGEKIDLDEGSIGKAREFFGITIDQKGNHVIEINQKRYTDEIVEKYSKRYGWRPKIKAGVPLRGVHTADLLNWNNEEEEEELDETILERYQTLFGSLLFLSIWTRPDISASLSLAGTRMKNPSRGHLKALQHILSYVHATSGLPIVYDARQSKNKVELAALCDADFGNDRKGGKSLTGYVTYLCGPIHWSSKKQTTVALSTTQAESNAALEATREIVFQSEILRQMGFNQKNVPLLIDNKQAIQRILANAPTPASKHELIRELWIQEICLKHEMIWPFYVGTQDNVADILTKGTIKGGPTQFLPLSRVLRGDTDHLESCGINTWIRNLMETKGAFTPDSKYKSLDCYRQARGDLTFPEAFQCTDKVNMESGGVSISVEDRQESMFTSATESGDPNRTSGAEEKIMEDIIVSPHNVSQTKTPGPC